MSPPPRTAARADFLPSEMKRGARLYFRVDERSPMGKMIYRASILENADGAFTLQIENHLPVEPLLGPSLKPGDYRNILMLRKLDRSRWAYLNVTRITGTAGLLSLPLRSKRASFVNRAAAMFLYFAGIPTDGPPPAVP